MLSSSEIEQDTEWVPHDIDVSRRTVGFLRIPAGQLAQPGFLFEFDPKLPSDRVRLSFDDVLAMKPTPAPLHFVFHSAFCRSTLLTRALNIPGLSDGLNEPGIFAALTNAGSAATPLFAPLLNLLARPRESQRIVFAKPTNHANRLIPALMAAVPDAKAVLMTTELSDFLASVRRRGLRGRRWARELFLEMQSYAGIDFHMGPRESFAMSDMQAAGLAWLLNQHLFQQLSTGVLRDRFRVLHGDWFNAHRAQTLAAVVDFAGAPISNEQASQAATGPAFSSHSKLGGNYTEERIAETVSPADRLHDEEVAQVRHWLEIIAGQMSLQLPAKQTLT